MFVNSMSERVRERASQERVSQSALADAAGLKRSSMTYYWRGERAYPLEAIPRIAAKLSTSVNWLITGHVEHVDDDTVGVQEIDLAYGLGGTFSTDMVEVQTHKFPKAWIENITSTPPSMLTFARGRGDSMQPTVQDGDMVLIDRSQRTVREWDAIWAMTVGEMAMIKRVRVRGEVVYILSDNERVPTEEVHHEEVNVVGRVIFIGRMI